MPQHWTVLGRRQGRRNGDHHGEPDPSPIRPSAAETADLLALPPLLAHGRHLHSRLQVLRDQDFQSTTASRRARAGEHRRSHLAVGSWLHCHDLGRP